MVYQIDGAFASSLAARQALIDQHSCVILATNELDNTQLPPQEVLAGYQGQVHAERGFRFRVRWDQDDERGRRPKRVDVDEIELGAEALP